MKKAPQLFLIAFLAILGAVLAYAVLGGDPAEDAQSDEDFLATLNDTGAPSASGDAKNMLPPSSSGVGPKIEVETDMYMMGTIANDRIGEGKVTVYNRGGAPLKIAKVTTSCGCTLGRMSKNVILPGEEATLEVRVYPDKVPGHFHSMKTLTIFSNDPINNRTHVVVNAYIDREFDWQPESANFGIVAKDSGSEIRIHFTQEQEAFFEILSASIRTSSNVFSFEQEDVPESEWQKPGHREYILIAKVLPDAPVGDYYSNLVIRTNISRVPNIKIPLSASVRGVYNLSPGSLSLPFLRPGESLKEVMTLSADIPLELGSIVAKHGDVIQVTHRPGTEPNSIVFDIDVAESPEHGVHNEKWTLDIVVDGVHYSETIKVLLSIVSDAEESD
ncbi:MAG: DUF1573 domain-containing protein [Candidatus Hydrogenedentes bacterium]|nr:DUF1573 domain-containing protein [Candidatus Hydrogenedentota bacterium]